MSINDNLVNSRGWCWCFLHSFFGSTSQGQHPTMDRHSPNEGSRGRWTVPIGEALDRSRANCVPKAGGRRQAESVRRLWLLQGRGPDGVRADVKMRKVNPDARCRCW